jgi:6-phosphogluconolactonase
MTLRALTTSDAPDAAAGACAEWIAKRLAGALDARGIASVAFSGGSSPAPMLRLLASSAMVDWRRVHVFQVDERMAPEGSPDRNATQLRALLLDVVGTPEDHRHLVAVGENRPAEDVARDYAAVLEHVTGGVIDVVHLGLGDDGHTASLVPGDALLLEAAVLVGATGEYKGFRRVSLTYPALAAANHIAWFAVGADKAEPLRKLLASDPSIPAGRVEANDEMVFADRAACGT